MLRTGGITDEKEIAGDTSFRAAPADIQSGCGAKPAVSGSLVGTWKDDYGLTEYQFEDSGTMKIQALSLGSFRGTYKLNGDKITLHYRVLAKDVNDTYQVKSTETVCISTETNSHGKNKKENGAVYTAPFVISDFSPNASLTHIECHYYRYVLMLAA